LLADTAADCVSIAWRTQLTFVLLPIHGSAREAEVVPCTASLDRL